tara:strand:+ start:958 stop:2067 length:1110 start_codon:yes stop_codon:yes gene_type:complete
MTKAAELAALIGSQTALSNRNLVINGAMNVAQRGTSSTGIGASSGYFTVDRFTIRTSSTAGRLTMTQTAVTDLPGFANCIKLDCTTADTSIAAAEFTFLSTRLEGQNLQQMKKGTSSAESVTVSFYVKGNAAATYVCEIGDSDNTRTITQAFAVTTSWNRISLTFPGDTTGAFDDDNAHSLQLNFWLHGGSTYSGGTFADNTWAAETNANRYAGSRTSFFDSTDREFFITGVQMEIGEVATPFEHRTFADDLAACQRYFQKSYDYGTDIGTGTTIGAMFDRHTAGAAVSNRAPNITFPVEMRAATTTVVYSLNGTAAAASDCGTGFGHDSDITSTTFSGTDGTHGLSRMGLGAAADSMIGFHYTADAEL